MTDESAALSEREIEILRLVATGAANKEIAARLSISPNTVKVHLRNIFAKIGVASRTEAALYALNAGLTGESAPLANELPARAPDPLALAAAEAEALGPEAPLARPRRLWSGLIPALALAALALAAGLFFWLGRARALPAAPTPSPSALPQDPAAARWRSLAAPPQPLDHPCGLAYANQVYLFGSAPSAPGRIALERLGADGQWSVLAGAPEGSAAGCALLGEKIYLPGLGSADGGPTPAMAVYDPRADRWSQKAPLPRALDRFGLTAFEGKLYLFGGWDGSQYRAEVWVYDPAADRWSPGTALPQPRADLSVESVEGKIVLSGGSGPGGPTRETLLYYPSREGGADSPWSRGPDLPQARSGMSSVSLANMVYLFGGADSPGAPPALVLDPDQGAWTALQLPAGLSLPAGGAAVKLGNYIHLFSGAQHLVYQAIFTINIPLTSN